MSIFRKPKTGNITSETLHTSTPPMPSCESPKKELPEPPFNAAVARSYAHWKEEEAINVIKNKIWESITKEVKKGGVILCTFFDLCPYYSPLKAVSDTERACILLCSKFYKILVDFGAELVKMGYTITVINDVYPDEYYDVAMDKARISTSNNHSLDRIGIKIYWGTSENTQEPYLKTIDYSGPLTKELDKNGTEHFIRFKKVVIKTKGELENGDKSNG